MPSKTIVYCTTCKGRTQHLEQTLPQNLRHNVRDDAKFVVLNYNSTDHLNTFLQSSHREDMESGRLVVYEFKAATPFRMAHAKNMAHRCGALEGGSILVNLDADNFTGEGFSDFVMENMPDNFCFLWAKRIQDQTPKGINGRIAVVGKSFCQSRRVRREIQFVVP